MNRRNHRFQDNFFFRSLTVLFSLILGFLLLGGSMPGWFRHCLGVVPAEAYTWNPLDEIENYDVTVEMNRDGSAHIHYHLRWKVLDDTKDGALKWVKIGIANKHVRDIVSDSPNVRKIRYYSDDGDYVRIDFDRKYYEGEELEFDFSLN